MHDTINSVQDKQTTMRLKDRKFKTALLTIAENIFFAYLNFARGRDGGLF